jgi:hypothetical protein
VEAWYQRYSADGLIVVGVHTPEFAFEHVVSNVRSAVQQFGITYPVAIDNSYDTWNAYDNEYWPADYLIDASGEVRYESFGEGQYGQTETAIRQLLVAANPHVKLPPTTAVPDLTPTELISPETYLGYSRLQYLAGVTSIQDDAPATYTFPSSIVAGEYGLSGTWTIGSEESTSGANARLELNFEAKDVYLVLGGSGTLSLTLAGRALATIDVSGIPRLYTLVSGPSEQTALLVLTASPGLEAYDFTFG